MPVPKKLSIEEIEIGNFQSIILKHESKILEQAKTIELLRFNMTGLNESNKALRSRMAEQSKNISDEITRSKAEFYDFIRRFANRGLI